MALAAEAPSISVALATYNGGRHLREQLDSLAAQTLRPLELIVSDDGSTDDTVAQVEAFAATAPFPVRVLRNERPLGYRLNFRQAAQACSGELIAFCDQDDIWRADKLERMAQAFANPAVMLAYHNAWAFNETARRFLHDPAFERAELAQQPIPPFKAVNGLLQIFRADLRRFDRLWDDSIDQNEGNVILAHDQWYFFLALLLGRVVFVDAELLDYRQHANNTYGVKVDRPLIVRMAERLKHYGDQDRWMALSARSRARIAEQITAEEGRPGTDVIAMYDRLAERMERRAATYTNGRMDQRLRALVQSWGAGDYGGATGFKRSSVVRDFWSGVLMRRATDPTRS
ncbi:MULTISPECIES: glycosyltransferase [Sphingomonas]|uniref:glycosyltransferase n=1 Tax=Sphingomonas TaxID=13687 RepID=UPI000DEF20D9|nr:MULTISPECIES: glycosyltransferase [Sphingomonas]